MSMKPDFTQPTRGGKISRWIKRHGLFLYSIPIFVFVLAITTYALVVKPIFALRADAIRFVQAKETIQEALQEKDFPQLIEEVLTLRTIHDQTQKDFQKLGYAKVIPFARGYYLDGELMLSILGRGITVAEQSVIALEPHRVLLGFEVDQPLTTEQQILQIAQITPQLIPIMQTLKTEITAVEAELAQIKISRYPADFRGIQVHDTYNQIRNETLPFLNKLITNIEPILPEIPLALGSAEPTRYLFIFQNDKEIRPTGGFITAYAIISFDGGSFSILDSGDIYDIDPEVSLIPMPLPIAQYLGVTEYNMRDTNFTPDFYLSMQDLEKYYPQTGLPEVKGIIALDTQFLQAMLEYLGPVTMEEYSLDFSNNASLPESCTVGGTSFTSENVVCRLELYAQKILDYHNDRKRILGDLMDEIVEKILVLESKELPSFMEVMLQELDEKHMLVYLHSESLQDFVESFNWAGRMQETGEGRDYLQINDANLAGRKSDMYLMRTVDQKVTVADDGTVEETVTLSYTNPKPQDNWLNNVARNYVRLYVPIGSELLSTSGDLSQVPTTQEELGKTVFDTFVAIPPLESKTVTFTYRLPFKIQDKYELDLQKQPGKDKIKHTLTVNNEIFEFELVKDIAKEVDL